MFINFNDSEIFKTVLGLNNDLDIACSEYSRLRNEWATYASWFEYHEFSNGADVRLQVVSIGKNITPTSKIMVGVYHTNDVMSTIALFPMEQIDSAFTYYRQQIADN